MGKQVAARDAFVYGLVDPREPDFEKALRYIGQTMVGEQRPRAHFREEEALRNDNNKHKANWVRQMKQAGLLPGIVILERVEDRGLTESEVKLCLDEAERELIDRYRSTGSPLLNVQAGGTSGYVLSDEERSKISLARSWVPTQKTLRSDDASVVLGPWNHEKSWWLGVTFVRGQVRMVAERRNVSIRTEHIELAQKWRTLIGGESRSIRWRDSGWEVGLGDVRVVQWLSEKYGLHEKWSTGVTWPADLPEEFAMDFIRGIWDVKGYFQFKLRDERQPIARTCVESCSWTPEFVQAIAGRIPGAKTYGGSGPTGVGVRGAALIPFLRMLYDGAPESISLGRQRDRAKEVCEQWERLLRKCERCGGEAAVGKDLCHPCSRRKWVGVSCACGRVDVIAKGMCPPCYQRYWVARKKLWDEAAAKSLMDVDPKQWQMASDDEKEQVVEMVFEAFRSRGFPWSVVEGAKEDDVLLRVGRGALTVDGDDLKYASRAGQRTCLAHCSHRLRAAHDGEFSVFAGYGDDPTLRGAIRFQLEHGDPVTPSRLLRALSALLKGPTNFPPVLARFFVDQYVPQGGTVLDPCAGFGGRLLGVMSSAKMARYVGYDIEPATVRGNQRLAEHLGVTERASVAEAAVEDGTPWPGADLLLTSPPYFDREDYGARSMGKLPTTFEQWSSGFLATLVSRGLECSKRIAICTSPLKSHGVVMDLPAEVVKHVLAVGGTVERQWHWHISSFGAGGRYETIVVASRPHGG